MKADDREVSIDLKKYGSHVLRHGGEHHLHHCFRRGDVVLQHPFLRHADSAHTIKPNTVSKLGVEDLGAQLFFCQFRIAPDKVFQHVVPQRVLGHVLIGTLVGTGGLTLFPGTPLLEEAQRGEFDPLTEKEMLEELKTFVENLTVDCSFITHHTVAANLTGPNFLARKDKIIAALDYAIHNGDMDRMAALRRNKRTL